MVKIETEMSAPAKPKKMLRMISMHVRNANGFHKGDWVFKKYFKISNRSFSAVFFILDKSPILSLLFPNTPTQHQKPSF